MSTNSYLNLPHPRLRTPRNRSACLWHLLNLVSSGHRYHTSGCISDPKKVPGFVEKMDEQFGVLLSHSARTKRHKKGVPTARLVMYRDWDDVWLWWLLFAGREKEVRHISEKYNEKLKDSFRTDGRLTFRNEYILRTRQRTQNQGGGRVLTWFLCKRKQTEIEKQIVAFACSHGRNQERVDDLVKAIQVLRNKPMFNGVRNQAKHILRRAEKVWAKTHSSNNNLPEIIKEPLPFFKGRIAIYEKN